MLRRLFAPLIFTGSLFFTDCAATGGRDKPTPTSRRALRLERAEPAAPDS
ncbi:MAG: hypothetical protein H7Z21_15450, partial [Hymenobacter sp.]|nr:hypothetical protein [Hymenobacter sp.]